MFILFMMLLLVVGGFMAVNYFVTKRNTDRMQEAYRTYKDEVNDENPTP